MDNYAIAEQFSLLAKLMDIHGENAFKAKSYASTAFAIEKHPVQLASLSEAQLYKLKGVGESAGKKVMELLQTGELKTLQTLLAQTPAGVLEMLNVKGLGPKKIHTLWKDLHIDTIDALEQACIDNRIAALKGFGEKTQQKILEAISFARSSTGQFLYKQVEDFALALQNKLEKEFSAKEVMLTGEFRRQLEVVNQLEWVTTVEPEALKRAIENEQVQVVEESAGQLSFLAGNVLRLVFHCCHQREAALKLLETSSSPEFFEALQPKLTRTSGATEAALFKNAGLPFIPPYLREKPSVLEQANIPEPSAIVDTASIKGLIHSHSTWSDGAHTIEQMAEELIRLGFEYMVISDHSKSAYYANGLSEERIREQHASIDALNKKLAPFKIFKGIECDILGDGSLDYDESVLRSFDLVITSIHSNLDMDTDKAMLRLMGAITHPCTTILGHLTGRLLLKRKGYPVDHKAIIDACAANHVVIEINASPNRLDLDWRWIDYALEKDVLLSIDPDAHSLEEFGYIKYGTLVAQKGGLPAARNLSSFSRRAFEAYLEDTKRIKKGRVNR